MQIILKGSRKETRNWLRKIERMTGKKINYTGVTSEDGECTYTVEVGTKEDYPRQRIVRKYIDKEYPIFKREERISI